MKVLNEIRLSDNRILLKDNLVKSPILPRLSQELERDVVVLGNCEVEGAIFAHNLEVQNGPLRVNGSVYAQVELHVNSDAAGSVLFEKAVGSSNAIISLAPGCRAHFLADVSAKQVKLNNAYVAANIFADEIVLENCVVIGGVFATRSLELSNCIVGTFNSPVVRSSKIVYLLFPSAFSVEKMNCLPGTEFFSLTLADLGALMRGAVEAENTGKIGMNVEQDEVKTVLTADGVQQVLRTYSVIGKVLATGLVDYDRLQNQLLISCASLGSQLLRTYDLGLDKDGKPIELTSERIAEFFFDILQGKISISTISGEFNLASMVNGLNPVMSVESQPTPPLSPDESTELESPPVPIPEATESEVNESEEPLASVTQVAKPDELASQQMPGTGDRATEPLNTLGVPQEVPSKSREVIGITCRYCGAAVEEGCSFCESCGKSLE
jgi:hypothetical protein